MAGKFWDRGVTLVPGCTKVSPGCKHCWSEGKGARFPNPANKPYLDADGNFTGKVGWRIDLLKKALKSKDRVLAIWNDFYHEGITDEQRDEAIGQMMAYPGKIILIVTKRPERAVIYAERHFTEIEAYARSEVLKIPYHIWHLITVENQEQADKRIPHVLRIPGKRGLLIEPMLGEVEIYKSVHCSFCGATAVTPYSDRCAVCQTAESPLDHIHQVILGAETGTDARPIPSIDAVRRVRDDCKVAGVPFYLKTLGKGKGRKLDGVEHNELAWEAK